MKQSNFAERLSSALKLRGIRPVDLSHQTGISKSLISEYMSGLRPNPRQDKIFTIAQILDVDEGWLMGYDTEMSRRPRGVSPPVTGMSSGVSVSSPGALTLLASYRSLNAAGRERLLERASELADHPRYREASECGIRRSSA